MSLPVLLEIGVFGYVKILGRCPEMERSQVDSMRLSLFVHLLCRNEEVFDTKYGKWRMTLGIHMDERVPEMPGPPGKSHFSRSPDGRRLTFPHGQGNLTRK